MLESTGRPAQIVTVGLHDTIKQAAEKMSSHNIGCLIVSDESGRFIGLVTERDISNCVAASPDKPGTVEVAEIMTDHVVTCAPGTPASNVREIMTTHRIRHLPIIEEGVVVGVLSARDVMGQQLLEDRAAAEEVAMLSNCLKSIDLNEAVEIVAAEVPRLFDAKNCVLCLYRGEHWAEAPELVSSNRCPCLDGHLHGVNSELPAEGGHCDDTIPAQCEKCGGQPPRLVIPLSVVGMKESGTGTEKRLSGYLCMCGLAPSSTSNRELMAYKAKLTREIITAHLSNATRYQQARLTSLTDALTGVGSRKLLEEKLQAECERAQRYKRPFSIAIIDLDHFKMINDTLGHAAGDDAIRTLAACMEKEKRVPDILARYGGDEFVVLMPATDEAGARRVGDKVIAAMRQRNDHQPEGPRLSASLGVHTADGSSVEALLQEADRRMYAMKRARQRD
jgi:diguanylate cyclase (GGDEF)-like protein